MDYTQRRKTLRGDKMKIHPNVIGRARPVLFIVANYLKTRTFTSIRVIVRDLFISSTSAGCVLKVLGWTKITNSSRRYVR